MYSFKHDVRRNVALSRQIHPLFFKKRPDGKYYCLKKKKNNNMPVRTNCGCDVWGSCLYLLCLSERDEHALASPQQ